MRELLPQIRDRINFLRPQPKRKVLRDVVRLLDETGVAILENVVGATFIKEARKDINRFVTILPSIAGQVRIKPRSTGGTRDYLVHEYQKDLCVYRSHDPLVFSPTYAQFLHLPEVHEVVRGYLGIPWCYQAMIVTRTEPVTWTGKGFDGWHHDARGRKLNVFLLLNDVSKDGQGTSVIKGTHKLLYDRQRQLKNFFRDEDVLQMKERNNWEEHLCAAPAGSLVFFDAQALHRGRRSPKLRDVFQVNCMTKKRHCWSHCITKSIYRDLDPKLQTFLKRKSKLRIIQSIQSF